MEDLQRRVETWVRDKMAGNRQSEEELKRVEKEFNRIMELARNTIKDSEFVEFVNVGVFRGNEKKQSKKIHIDKNRSESKGEKEQILSSAPSNVYNEREKLLEIERDMIMLQRLFDDLRGIVETQNSSLDTLEQNVVNTNESVGSGVTLLQEAHVYSVRNAAIAGGIIGVGIGGPVGMLLGAKVGVAAMTGLTGVTAFLGGATGYFAGSFLQTSATVTPNAEKQ